MHAIFITQDMFYIYWLFSVSSSSPVWVLTLVIVVVFLTTPTAVCLGVNLFAEVWCVQHRRSYSMLWGDYIQTLELKCFNSLKENTRNRRNNQIISSSVLLCEKYTLQSTLNSHYTALKTEKNAHAHTRAHTAYNLAHSYLMVNAWNVTVPYHSPFCWWI